jgi:trk system potassium uptake protein
VANNKKKINQIAVIGLGRFGENVAITLTELGCNVLAIDADMNKVENIVDKVTHAVQADGTSKEGLKNLGLNNFDIVVVAIGNSIQASILATLIVKELGVETVIAKVSSELHAKVLEKIGVSRIIFPEKDSGNKLAHSLMSINLVEYLEISPDYGIAEIIIQGKYDGITLRDADLRNRYGLNILAIRNGEKTNISPQAEDLLKKGDMLVLLGHTSDLRRFDNC